MAKAENKTKPNQGSVTDFLDAIADDQKREDSYALLKMMKGVTRATPVLWGGSIVGFGKFRYRYETGREGDWFLAGFSPRKQALTVYIMAGFERYPELMARLGKHKSGKSCLYIKRLADVDQAALKELIKESAAYVKQHSVGC